MNLRFYAIVLILFLSPMLLKAEELTTPTLVQMEFRGILDFQFEVWLDGNPVGLTPKRVPLKPGSYLMTASSEGLEPVIQTLVVGDRGNQISMIQSLPLTPAVYQRAGNRVIQEIFNHPENQHFLVMAMQLARDSEDLEMLVERAKRFLPDHPETLLSQARLAIPKREYNEAWNLIDKALDANAGYSATWREKARLALIRDNLAEAREAADYAVALESNYWLNLELRAEILDREGRVSAAQYDRERAEELLLRFQSLISEHRR